MRVLTRPHGTSPRGVATVFTAGVAVTGFGLLRWLVAAHRDLSRFVVAGSTWVSPTRAPRFLHVFAHSNGYDGQFYWRLAADPFHLALASYLGVRFDSAYRLNRIFYPVLAWLVAAGRVREVDLTLVVVNVVAVVALVALAVHALARRGLDVRAAALVLAVPGLVGALSRDLTEALTCVLVVAAVLAAREKRHVLASVLLAAAVLTRETMLLVAAVYALAALRDLLQRRRGPARRDLVWLLPVVVMAIWQLVVRLDVGVTPLLSSAGSGDVGVPLWGLVRSVPGWFSPHTTHQLARGGLYVLQSAAAAWLLYQGWRVRHTVAEIERGIVAVFVVLWLCETAQGWAAPLDARYGTLPLALVWFHVLESGDRAARRRAALVLVPVVALTALWRILVI